MLSNTRKLLLRHDTSQHHARLELSACPLLRQRPQGCLSKLPDAVFNGNPHNPTSTALHVQVFVQCYKYCSCSISAIASFCHTAAHTPQPFTHFLHSWWHFFPTCQIDSPGADHASVVVPAFAEQAPVVPNQVQVQVVCRHLGFALLNLLKCALVEVQWRSACMQHSALPLSLSLSLSLCHGRREHMLSIWLRHYASEHDCDWACLKESSMHVQLASLAIVHAVTLP